MTHFVGTQEGKLDAKNRVSIPAPFRQELEAAGTDQIILRFSHVLPCVEVFGRSAYNQMLEAIRRMDMYSEERQDLEAAFISDCHMLRHDGEGRVVLPGDLVEELGVGGGAKLLFLGKGERFEIWPEERGRAHLAEAKARIREQRRTLATIPFSATPRIVP